MTPGYIVLGAYILVGFTTGWFTARKAAARISGMQDADIGLVFVLCGIFWPMVLLYLAIVLLGRLVREGVK